MQFELYLLKNGLITSDHLIEAIKKQQEVLPPLGQLAMEEGLMSVRDVFRVLRVQTDYAQEKFGETAVEMELLERRDVAELLLLQGERKRPLPEFLIDAGALERDLCERALQDFRREKEIGGAGGAVGVSRVEVKRPSHQNAANL